MDIVYEDITTRQAIEEIIYDGVVEVTFTKRDGSQRVMNCTLSKDVVPPATKDPLTQTKVRKLNEDVMVVWDTDKNDWRSFRLDQVKQFYQKEKIDA